MKQTNRFPGSHFRTMTALSVVVLAAAIWFGAVAAQAQPPAPTALVPRPEADMVQRHEAMNARVKQGNVDLVFIGDSITHGWEGDGKAVWDAFYGDRNAVNLGISGDKTYHVLWRLENGNLAGISPKLAVIMIGTNNAGEHSPEQIAEGVTAVVNKVREKCPNTKVLLLGIFPRDEKPDGQLRVKVVAANQLLAKVADNKSVFFLDIGSEFLDDNGVLPASIMPDFLHPNALGYQIWAQTIEPTVARLMGDLDAGKAPKGYVALFDGKDLNGWKGVPQSPLDSPENRAKATPEELASAQAAANQLAQEHWKPVDGALEYDGKGFSLSTARDYEDFEMIVDWKIESKGDSGIYLRGAPQVQIWDPAQWPVGSGGLYNNQKHPKDPLVCADNPIGEWNTFQIKMVGEHVTVYLNNKLVVNTVLENYWNYDIPIYPAGPIELQHHGSTLWFKNIYIREIPRGDGWRDLFNGKDLTGWEEVGGKVKTWQVENGILFTNGGEGGWLSTTEEFGDFDLELEFRVPAGGNSGVFFRAPREGNPAFEGSEVQVLDDNDPQYATLKPWQYCGSVYTVAAPTKRVALPAGTWQKMQIHCQGQKVLVSLNCIPVVDADLDNPVDKEQVHPGLKRTQGYIGLQNHGSRLDYRNIRIRPLK